MAEANSDASSDALLVVGDTFVDVCAGGLRFFPHDVVLKSCDPHGLSILLGRQPPQAVHRLGEHLKTLAISEPDD